MRLGGMTPARALYELPATFKVSKVLFDEDHVTFFCNHNEENGDVLQWTSLNKIEVRGRQYDLTISPSHRTSWCTFTIPCSQWSKK